MVDFTQSPINKFRGYGGANGNKINISYNNVSYMLKFPPASKKNKELSYINSCISEYIACHVFESIGLKTQQTIIGTYSVSSGKEKIVVACKDFTENGKKLLEFAHLKNTCIDSEQNGYGKDLDSILQAIEEQELIDTLILKRFFWDMFIVDALLGNFDRHNGNWGILVDEKTQSAEIAPIYDCGSCLYPQLDVNGMKYVLESEDEMSVRIYTFPRSAIEDNGQKISYFEFISSKNNADCTEALERIIKKIQFEKIDEIIDNTPTLVDVQRTFYKTMIKERFEKILLVD